MIDCPDDNKLVCSSSYLLVKLVICCFAMSYCVNCNGVSISESEETFGCPAFSSLRKLRNNCCICFVFIGLKCKK